MVSKNLKLRYSAEKLKRAGKIAIPVLQKESISNFTNEILRENEDIRRATIFNPEYKQYLEKKVAERLKENKGILLGAKIVDSIDRITSAIGMVGDAVGPFSFGLGNIISALEEIPEIVPKLIYMAYYYAKTKDIKPIPYWTFLEILSNVPYGDSIDLMNIYINKVRKKVKEEVVRDVKKVLPSKLELKVSEFSNN